jgi:hypothetical protein
MSKLWARIVLALVLTVGVGNSVGRADEGQVDLLLVLAADVSRSVDDREFRLQRDGFAAAIVEPRVLRAMTSGPIGRIAVVFVEWASQFEQKVIVDWAVIGGEHDAQAVSERIRAAPRSYWGRTSISGAIDYSLTLLERSPFQAARRVIDISGDGTNNSGIDVAVSRDAAVARDVTINGLVILSDEPLPTNPTHTHPPGGLTAYFERNVIGGPGAFVMEAQSFEAFGQALISKLIKEIAALAAEGRSVE